jgi:membrane protein insertase Oxa1/YidC/SpoIIIJ
METANGSLANSFAGFPRRSGGGCDRMTSHTASQELYKPLKIAPVSGVLSLLIAIGIIFIGLREYF